MIPAFMLFYAETGFEKIRSRYNPTNVSVQKAVEIKK